MMNLIKSFILGSLLIISAYSILPQEIQAERTPYYDEALRRCIQQCDQIFSWPFNQACHAGCYIGLEHLR